MRALSPARRFESARSAAIATSGYDDGARSGARPCFDSDLCAVAHGPPPLWLEQRAPQKGAPRYINLRLVGDVMLGRGLNEALARHGLEYPWGDTLACLRPRSPGTMLIGNLETAITERGAPWPRKTFHFRMHPAFAGTLRVAGFSYVSCANNHVLDFGAEGLRDTLATLDALGVAHAGAGMNLAEASAPAFVWLSGSGDRDEGTGAERPLRVGFVAAADHPRDWAADAARPGVFFVDTEAGPWDPLLHAVRTAASASDVTIVTLHAGPNWVPSGTPGPAQQSLAHALVDAGATVVHTTSSHHVLPIERYRDGLVLYGQGDFVDDYAIDPLFRNDLGCIVCAKIEVPPLRDDQGLLAAASRRRPKVVAVEALPTRIHNMRVSVSQSDAERRHVLQALFRPLPIAP